jgi:hypothetical protein
MIQQESPDHCWHLNINLPSLSELQMTFFHFELPNLLFLQTNTQSRLRQASVWLLNSCVLQQKPWTTTKDQREEKVTKDFMCSPSALHL